MIQIDTEWLLRRFGIEVDPEVMELATIFTMRLKNAPDKKRFLIDSLRAALGGAPNVTRGR